MKKKYGMWLLLTCFIILNIASTTRAEDQYELTMEFAPAKKTYLLGETVTVICKFKNISTQDIYLVNDAAWMTSSSHEKPDLDMFDFKPVRIGGGTSSREKKYTEEDYYKIEPDKFFAKEFRMVLRESGTIKLHCSLSSKQNTYYQKESLEEWYLEAADITKNADDIAEHAPKQKILEGAWTGHAFTEGRISVDEELSPEASKALDKVRDDLGYENKISRGRLCTLLSFAPSKTSKSLLAGLPLKNDKNSQYPFRVSEKNRLEIICAASGFVDFSDGYRIVNYLYYLFLEHHGALLSTERTCIIEVLSRAVKGINVTADDFSDFPEKYEYQLKPERAEKINNIIKLYLTKP